MGHLRTCVDAKLQCGCSGFKRTSVGGNGGIFIVFDVFAARCVRNWGCDYKREGGSPDFNVILRTVGIGAGRRSAQREDTNEQGVRNART